VISVSPDLRGQLVDATLLGRRHSDHGSLPAVDRVLIEVDHAVEVANDLVGARQVGLGDYEDVGDLEDAGLERLDAVTQER
jgi:hypothetical protein